MSKPKYVGEHRSPQSSEDTTVRKVVTSKWTRRILVPVTALVIATLGITSTAFASPIPVKPGDTFSGLVASHCKTNNWKGVSFPNRNKNLIYAGETIDITCSGETPVRTSIKKSEPPVVVPAVSKQVLGWVNPLPGYKSYCNFGQWRGSYSHRGEDIPAPTGTPIHAVHAGIVKVQYDAGGGGNMTIVTHDGMAEVYMHQSRYAIRSGSVGAGDIIGYVGSTGDASGPHLHLEIQPNGPWKGVTSPDKWLAARGVFIGC